MDGQNLILRKVILASNHGCWCGDERSRAALTGSGDAGKLAGGAMATPRWRRLSMCNRAQISMVLPPTGAA
jgi:hypothetical protein